MASSAATRHEAPTNELVTVTRTLDHWRLLRLVLGAQGLGFLSIGLWPLAHLRSFVWAFGERGSVFQLYLTAALLVVIGAVLLLAALRSRPDPLLVALGLGAGGAVLLTEWQARHLLHPIVWLHFALEAILVILLLGTYLAARWRERRQRRV